MRTTVTISDELLLAARERARAQGQTLGDVVDAALRRELNTAAENDPPEVPVFRGRGGSAPGLDMTSNRAMHEFLDEGVPVEKRR